MGIGAGCAQIVFSRWLLAVAGEGSTVLMAHVFLSYTGQDTASAHQIKCQIEGAGFEVWPDAHGAQARNTWNEHSDVIDRAIRDSFALVVVLTPDAHASSQIMYEWTFALGVGVRVIPVLCQPTELHHRLAKLECLDFTNKSSQPWGRLIGVLHEARAQRSSFAAPDQDKLPSLLAR